MGSKIKNTIEILLIEDNPGDILLIKDVLNEDNDPFDLKVIKDGGEAMDYLGSLSRNQQNGLPDLVILDLNLPKKNGREILASIRAVENLKDLSVIIFTSSDAEEDIAICRNLNVVSYYKKPIDYDEYVITVRAIKNSIKEIIALSGN
ncbi:MAG: response regulator [Syntrophothermus sp.]